MLSLSRPTARFSPSGPSAARVAEIFRTAIAHEGWNGNLPDGSAETAVNQTRLLYAGANRLTTTRLAVLDLPEGNALRAYPRLKSKLSARTAARR